MGQRLNTERAMDRIDDEALMAYADGELPPAKAAKIEAFLRTNDAARAKVARYRESAALARSAFANTLNQPVPERLVRAVRRGAARGDRRSWLRRLPWPAALSAPGLALAASCLLVIGVGMGYLAGERGGTGNGVTIADLGGSPLSRVLERTASGKAVSWTAGADGGTVTVTVRSTFRDKRGAYCREYRMLTAGTASERTVFGIACRTGEGRWQTRVAVTALPVAERQRNDKDFRPAAGRNEALDLIGAALDGMITGQPLSPAREAALTRTGWR